jgi:hypothetical protein
MNVTKNLLLSLGTTRREFNATSDMIVALLERSNHAVEQAVVRIYEHQTRDEKDISATVESNGIGFQACDARRGTYWARLILNGSHLFDYNLPKARRMAIKYRNQLTVLAFLKKKHADSAREARLERLSSVTTFNPEDLEREMVEQEYRASKRERETT